MSETETTSAPTGGIPFSTPEEWNNFYQKFGENGRTFQDLTSLTPQSMEVIYMVAFNHYNAGKYEDAERIFQLLSVLNHFDKRFWTGLGASREMQKKYDEALKAYTYLAVLELRDPLPPLLAAKCYMAMGKAKDAEGALHACIFNAGEAPQHAELKSQAQTLVELLAKTQSAN